MTPRLPPCAWCGASLARRDYILVVFRELKVAPRIGYHPECADADPAWKKAYDAQRDDFGHGSVASAKALLATAADRAANGYPGAPK